MRTTIQTDDKGYVTINYDCQMTGDRVTQTYFCPENGGYVKISDPEGRYPKVCERLSSRGNTLMSPNRSALADVIRREYRAMRRAEARVAA